MGPVLIRSLHHDVIPDMLREDYTTSWTHDVISPPEVFKTLQKGGPKVDPKGVKKGISTMGGTP